jgi:hypothetical protein
MCKELLSLLYLKDTKPERKPPDMHYRSRKKKHRSTAQWIQAHLPEELLWHLLSLFDKHLMNDLFGITMSLTNDLDGRRFFIMLMNPQAGFLDCI